MGDTRTSPSRPPISRRTARTRAAFLLELAGLAGATAVLCAAASAADGRLQLAVVETGTRSLVPGRIHLAGFDGKPIQAPNLPFWHDHFVCTGEVVLSLPAGPYRWEIERGPEWSRATGSVALAAGAVVAITNELRRIADLAREGWWGGETHVHRATREAELLMRAEDLPVAQFITWWNKTNPWTNSLPSTIPVPFDGHRSYHPLGGEDERDGGALLYLDLSAPLAITGGARHFPSSLLYAKQARDRGAEWIDAEKPFWWDLPMWLAHGAVDTVGIAHNHMHRGGVLDNEAWGRPRDRSRYPGPQGNGRYTQDIYYHALNCGVRVPPSAGSASGVLPNPVGYNRAYVHVDGPFTHAKWVAGLKAGRSFVSNGPLLRARAAGQVPGHTFRTNGTLTVHLDAALDSRDPIAAIELVRNGRVERIQLPADITFRESGWFLLRAIADVPQTFRFASTAPWHVELDGRPAKPARESAQYFVDWCRERMSRLESLQGVSARQREELLQPWRDAENFWRARLAGNP